MCWVKWVLAPMVVFAAWGVVLGGVGAGAQAEGDEDAVASVASEDYWARVRANEPAHVREICGRSVARDCLASIQIHSVSRAVERAVKFEVRQVLARQVFAWNTGDLDGFLSGYWPSEDLRFVDGDQSVLGIDGVRAHYSGQHSTRETMGDIVFTEIIVRPITAQAAIVFGLRHHDASEGEREGRFYFRLEKIDGAWVIVEHIGQ